MKKRPMSIKLIALLWLLQPLAALWLHTRSNGPFLAETSVIVHQPALGDWIILSLFPVVAAGVYSVRRWGWYLFIGFAPALIAYTLWGHGPGGSVCGGWTVAVFIAGVTFASTLFFRKHVYSPYFNPRLRWWESAPRYRVNLNTRFFTRKGEAGAVTMGDISSTGCFVNLVQALSVGERVWIVIRCANAEISCMGRVVRKGGAAGSPPGYGVMFDAMSRENRNKLGRLIRALVYLGGRDREGRLPPARVPAAFERLGRGRFLRLMGAFPGVDFP